MTAIHADAFARPAPVPGARDGLGAGRALVGARRAAGLPLGIVDATPIRHLRPVAASYPHAAAVAEADRVPRRPAVRDARAGGRGADRLAGAVTVRVAVVAEYYPRAADPVLGVWAHRQALAARDAGAEVRVLVLHRPVPSRAALRSRDPRALVAPLRQPLRTELDGLRVDYVPFVAPPRPRSYGSWGAWAAPSLALALRGLRREFPFDLVHAHYAAPAGDAVRRARAGVPAVVSVHGGDVLSVAAALARRRRGGARRARARRHRAGQLGRDRRGAAASSGARRTEVVHLGTDLPGPRDRRAPRRRRSSPSATSSPASATATCCARSGCCATATRRCATTSSATGPSAARSSGSRTSWSSTAACASAASSRPPRPARRRSAAGVFVLPSVDEAFGVAYVEAMAGAVPAIGCRGEPGPGGDRGGRRRAAARRRPATRRRSPPSCARCSTSRTGAASWARPRARPSRRRSRGSSCGRATVAAYEAALR